MENKSYSSIVASDVTTQSALAMYKCAKKIFVH